MYDFKCQGVIIAKLSNVTQNCVIWKTCLVQKDYVLSIAKISMAEFSEPIMNTCGKREQTEQRSSF